MNIFMVDEDPRIAAQAMVDRHVVKMILESGQLLSTAHRLLDGKETMAKSKTGRNVKRYVLPDEREPILYGATHINHPSAIWCRTSIENYSWLHHHMMALLEEYSYRYGKVHKCDSMRGPLFNCPLNIDYEAPWQDPPQAMPDDSKVDGDSVQGYRNYYINHKVRFAKWTKRTQPDWWKI